MKASSGVYTYIVPGTGIFTPPWYTIASASGKALQTFWASDVVCDSCMAPAGYGGGEGAEVPATGTTTTWGGTGVIGHSSCTDVTSVPSAVPSCDLLGCPPAGDYVVTMCASRGELGEGPDACVKVPFHLPTSDEVVGELPAASSSASESSVTSTAANSSVDSVVVPGPDASAPACAALAACCSSLPDEEGEACGKTTSDAPDNPTCPAALAAFRSEGQCGGTGGSATGPCNTLLACCWKYDDRSSVAGVDQAIACYDLVTQGDASACAANGACSQP